VRVEEKEARVYVSIKCGAKIGAHKFKQLGKSEIEVTEECME
jgi:hypothetical protein